jgi:hypothetical protein
VKRTLLVPAQHVMKLAAHIVKLVIDVQDGSARITEEGIDTFPEQGFTEYPRTAHRVRRFVGFDFIYRVPLNYRCHWNLLSKFKRPPSWFRMVARALNDMRDHHPLPESRIMLTMFTTRNSPSSDRLERTCDLTHAVSVFTD